MLDGVTGKPIADELYDRKDPETIKTFLEAHLDPRKPRVFGGFNGCEPDLPVMPPAPDFPKNGTIEQELIRYRLLNILYNRDAEIEILEEMVKEEQEMRLKGDAESGGVAVEAFVSSPGKTPKPTAKTLVL